MRVLKYLLKKEFIQIRRNRFMARVILVMPLVQMLILVPAVTFDIKEIKMCVVDQDQTSLSRGLVDKLEGSTFFKVVRNSFSISKAEELMHRDKIDIIVHIRRGFESDYMRENSASIQLLINGINGTAAQTSLSYCNRIIADYQRELAVKYFNQRASAFSARLDASTRYWYNPELNYAIYMAPGILAILVTAIGFLLSGLNLVREKEMGTSEQINVTPIKKHQFILGKIIPFLVIGLVDLAFGLTLAYMVYDLPVEGSLLLLFGYTVIYLISVMGFGLFISTFANTQQQYLFLAFFFMMIFVLMSGIFTPADSMPLWARWFNYLNPPAYFIRVIRMILLKGSGIADITRDIILLSLLALFMIIFASITYKKTT